jgi:uncharacterized small protein (DUF1192 family)
VNAPTDVTPEVVSGLLRKYRVLARWRRAKDRSVAAAGQATEVAAPAAMRALAEEFPGALRELDLLGLAELDRRVACLAAATADLEREDEREDEGEEWIVWIAAYHALMRHALALRSPSPPAGPPPIADATFLRDVQRPPGGRLSAAVMEALARHFRRPADELRRVLFPPRR